jgi:hypothetical protein
VYEYSQYFFSISLFFFAYLNLFIEMDLLIKTHSSDSNNQFTRFGSFCVLFLPVYRSEWIGLNRKRLQEQERERERKKKKDEEAVEKKRRDLTP